MPPFARNAIAFPIALAIYSGGLRAAGYVFSLLHVQWGLVAYLLFHCIFGALGYSLFQGKSRAVLVLFVSVTYAFAITAFASDGQNSGATIFIWISFGILAAITTNVTSWIVARINISDTVPAMKDAKEFENIARREPTLVYRLGKWVGRRRHTSAREK